LAILLEPLLVWLLLGLSGLPVLSVLPVLGIRLLRSVVGLALFLLRADVAEPLLELSRSAKSVFLPGAGIAAAVAVQLVQAVPSVEPRQMERTSC